MKYIALIVMMFIGGSVYAYNPATDVSSGATVNTGITNPHYRESQKSYNLYMSSGVYLFEIKGIVQPIWTDTGTSAKSLQANHKFDLVINGGYFTYHKDTNTFKPAGRIVNGLNVVQSMVKEFWAPDLDRNLAITLVYNKTHNSFRISHEDLVPPRRNIYSFYAGPLMIESGAIKSTINANVSHRQRKATRTFMIIDSKGKAHFGASIQGYTLPALAKKIQEMGVFDGPYHVINLDGGSSTSLAAGVRYRNSTARLPWFFGVK